MPQVNRALMFQLGIILLIVPAQYFITQRWQPASKATQQQSVKAMASQLQSWQTTIFSKATWQKWFGNVRDSLISYKNRAVEKVTTYATTSKAPTSSAAPPVVILDPETRRILNRRDREGNFASSSVVRSPRPPHIKFRLGQVIRHREYGYRGVIVGWDPIAKAPEQWLQAVHGEHRPSADTPYYAVLVDIADEFYEDGATVYIPQNIVTVVTIDTVHLRYQPQYSVLVDLQDRPGGQVTYIAEDNVFEVLKNFEVDHPQLKDYFNGFDGQKYSPKRWLKDLYPHD